MLTELGLLWLNMWFSSMCKLAHTYWFSSFLNKGALPPPSQISQCIAMHSTPRNLVVLINYRIFVIYYHSHFVSSLCFINNKISMSNMHQLPGVDVFRMNEGRTNKEVTNNITLSHTLLWILTTWYLYKLEHWFSEKFIPIQ